MATSSAAGARLFMAGAALGKALGGQGKVYDQSRSRLKGEIKDEVYTGERQDAARGARAARFPIVGTLSSAQPGDKLAAHDPPPVSGRAAGLPIST